MVLYDNENLGVKLNSDDLSDNILLWLTKLDRSGILNASLIDARIFS